MGKSTAILKPPRADTYKQLLETFDIAKRSGLPNHQKPFIDRHNLPPIWAFLNASIPNHQGIPTRIGHIPLSLQTPIHLDLLAWHTENSAHPDVMSQLQQVTEFDIITVEQSRNRANDKVH